jgi:hypothetical protein
MLWDVLVEFQDGRLDKYQATTALTDICKSVHANARGYGKMEGEEVVLDAVVYGGLDHKSAKGWLAVTREKLAKGKQAEAAT